jgi:nucleotide-binding universal stress UspA family protein
MSYSTIMVQMDLDGSNDGRLRVAAQLAKRFGSALTGIAAGDVQPMYFMDGAAAETFLEKDRAGLEAEMSRLEKEFRSRVDAISRSVEWRAALARPADYAACEARSADLIVTGSHRERINPLRQVDPGELVLRSGRPVLVVPPQVTEISLKNAVVAWKDTREARRAVSDALPLLHVAEHVLVVELVASQSERAAAKARVTDVATWLTRRGIVASTIATKELIGVPGQLDIVAQDEGADIIVAGAYGHTRFSEWVFGGVTRDLLRLGRRCAFLSH